jgi:hypothetical protein
MYFYVSEDHRLLHKQNVAQFMLLQDKERGFYLLTVNCHILFNRNRGDIKIAQIMLIRRAIHLIISQCKGMKVNVVWAGDFNTCQRSPIYNAILDGDFGDCVNYRKFEWSGQTSTFKLYRYSQFSRRKILDEMLPGRFVKGKSDRYYKPADSMDDFVHLISMLSRVELGFKQHEIAILKAPTDPELIYQINDFLGQGGTLEYGDVSGPMKFKSAHGEVRKDYLKTWMTGELMYTTKPEDQHFTVDYMM